MPILNLTSHSGVAEVPQRRELRMSHRLELKALTDLFSWSSPCSYFINGKRRKAAEFVLNHLYYCVPAEWSGVTDSSFGERGRVSISFSLRRTEAAHLQHRAQKPVKTTFSSPGPTPPPQKTVLFHSPFTL